MAGRSPTDGARGPAGTILRGSGKDGPQRIETTGHRWSDEAEALFLDSLAASCNVRHSARRTGFSAVAIYRRRRDDPAFAAKWQSALEQGYARIEMALVSAAADSLEGRVPDPDAPIPPMNAREALAVLAQHRDAATGGGRARTWNARPRSLDEMRDSIIAKFEMIEAARGRGD